MLFHQDSENNKCSEKINKGSQLREAFKMLDANFFDDTKVIVRIYFLIRVCVLFCY